MYANMFDLFQRCIKSFVIQSGVYQLSVNENIILSLCISRRCLEGCCLRYGYIHTFFLGGLTIQPLDVNKDTCVKDSCYYIWIKKLLANF